MVLISDGKETCEGDPCALVRSLREQGINVRVHVVGFDVNQEERDQLVCIAEAGEGKYFSADNADQLTVALTEVKQEIIAAKEPQPKPEPPPPQEPVFSGKSSKLPTSGGLNKETAEAISLDTTIEGSSNTRSPVSIASITRTHLRLASRYTVKKLEKERFEFPLF